MRLRWYTVSRNAAKRCDSVSPTPTGPATAVPAVAATSAHASHPAAQTTGRRARDAGTPRAGAPAPANRIPSAMRTAYFVRTVNRTPKLRYDGSRNMPVTNAFSYAFV